MIPTAHRPIRGLLGVLFLVLAVVACGDSGTEGTTSVDVLGRAAASVREAGTAGFALEGTTEYLEDSPGRGRGQKDTFSAEGAVDFRAKRALVSMRAPLAEGDLSIRLVSEPDATFLFVPEDRRNRTDGRGWVRFPDDAGAAFFRPDTWVDQVARWEAQGARVTKTGEEEVNGVSTTRYHVEVAPRTTSSEGGRSESAGVSADIWVDDDGLLVRGVSQTKASYIRQHGRFDLFDVGEPVDIPRPAEDEVLDVKDYNAALDLVYADPDDEQTQPGSTIVVGEPADASTRERREGE